MPTILPLVVALVPLLDRDDQAAAVAGHEGPLDRAASGCSPRIFSGNAVAGRLAVLLGDEVEDRPAEHLLARVAEHLALGLVDVDDPPLGVDLVVADGGLVVEPPEPLLRLPERVLDLLPLGRCR